MDQNCEKSCYHYFSVIVLFIVIIKCIIYIFSQCVCDSIPPGSFHSFQKKREELKKIVHNI